MRTALHYACLTGHIDLVIFYIEKGCDLDQLDFNKKTALYYAIEKKHY